MTKKSKGKRRAPRLMRSCLVTMSLLVAGVGYVDVANASSVVANPGTFHAIVNSAYFDINAVPVSINATSSYIEGTVDSNGTISIPASGVHIEEISFHALSTDFHITLQATDTWTGQIDPSTGEVAIRMKAQINISNFSNCTVGPLDINRALGADYNTSTGAFSVSNETYSIPTVSDTACGVSDSVFLGPAINSDLGLGLSSWVTGRGKTTWHFTLDPIITSGGGTLGGLSATDPFDTSSGGNSTSVSSSTTNIYGTSSAAAPKIRLGASIASKRYKKSGYVSIYASSSEDATLKVTGKLSGGVKGNLGSDKDIVEADEETTFKLKVSRKLRKKIAAAKARGRKVYASIRVTADNGGDDPTVKKIAKFKL